MVLTLPLTSSLRLGPPGGEDPTNSQRTPRTRARGGDQTNEHCPASQSNLGVHVGTSGLGGNTLDCPSLVSQSEKPQPRKGRKEQLKPHHTSAAKPAGPGPHAPSYCPRLFLCPVAPNLHPMLSQFESPLPPPSFQQEAELPRVLGLQAPDLCDEPDLCDGSYHQSACITKHSPPPAPLKSDWVLDSGSWGWAGV